MLWSSRVNQSAVVTTEYFCMYAFYIFFFVLTQCVIYADKKNLANTALEDQTGDILNFCCCLQVFPTLQMLSSPKPFIPTKDTNLKKKHIKIGYKYILSFFNKLNNFLRQMGTVFFYSSVFVSWNQIQLQCLCPLLWRDMSPSATACLTDMVF